jgi:putative protein-disulfide isomerase
LAPDTDEPMPEAMRNKIQQIWRTIESEVPGVRFNFDFWKKCKPRRSTYPACRAVIAASRQNPALEAEMIRSIQTAYYREARNPSDPPVLVDLAGSLGLDRQQFAEDLESIETASELNRQIAFARGLGVLGFPSLVLEHHAREYKRLEVTYRDAESMLEQIAEIIEVRF